MGTKKLDPAEKARRAQERERAREKGKGKKAVEVAQSGTLADPIEARGAVVEDYEIVGELSPEDAQPSAPLDTERDGVLVFDAADPAFTGDEKVIGANVYKYDSGAFSYPQLLDGAPWAPDEKVLTFLSGEPPTWNEPIAFDSGQAGEEGHKVYLWHADAIEDGDDAGPDEWRVRHHLAPDRARIGTPISLDGLLDVYKVRVHDIDSAGDEVPTAMYRGAPVAPEDALATLDAATWNDPLTVTLYGRTAYLWTSPAGQDHAGAWEAETVEIWDVPPTSDASGDAFDAVADHWFVQMMDGTKGNGSPIVSSLPDDVGKLRDNADGSIDAQQDDGSWKRIYTPTKPSNYGKNGEMFDDSLVRAPDRPPGYCPTITLGAPGLYAITRRALAKNADRIEKLASDTKREGFERQAREMIGDAKAIREDILPHFGGEQELPLAQFDDVERAVAAAVSGGLSGNARSPEAAKLLEAMIADRVAKFVILVAERAFHAGEQAREFTAETFALRSVSRLFEADSKGGDDA
jgi:hypothetical protein